MKKREIILEQLKVMGFEPIELDDVGYVFVYEDLPYLYMPDEEDDNFLRITIPHLYEVTAENRMAVLEASHETECLVKYIKIGIRYDTSVWVIYEHCLNSTDNLVELLEHIIHVIKASVYVFNKKMNGEEVVMQTGNSEESSDDALESELQKMLDSIEDE